MNDELGVSGDAPPAPEPPGGTGVALAEVEPAVPPRPTAVLTIEHVTIATRPRFIVDGRPIGATTILEDVSLAVPGGAFVALVGESGAGKSLLSHAVLGLLPADRWDVSGTVIFNGTPISGSSTDGMIERARRNARRDGIGVIFQEPASYLNPSLRIWRQLGERLTPEEGLTAASQRLADQLQAVRLVPAGPEAGRTADDYLRRFPHQFSQGQQQRLMSAMALGGFDLVIADEPTASLDTTIQKEFVDLLCRLRDEGRLRSLLLITHDLRLVRALLHQPGDSVYFLGRESALEPYRLVAQLAAGDLFNGTAGPFPPFVQTQIAVARSYWSAGAAPLTSVVPGTSAETHLIVKNLIQAYPTGLFRKAKVVLKVDDLEVQKGEIVGIVGESGCGKSTLVRAVTRLVRHTDPQSQILYRDQQGSEVDLAKLQPDGLGRDTSAMRRIRQEMQIIFQDASTAFNPQLTIREMIDETIAMVERQNGRRPQDQRQELSQLCLDLNLASAPEEVGRLLDHYPSELSAGQRQRFALARVLLTRPSLLIADEPFTNVDRLTVCDMVRVLERYRRDYRMTVVIISHDLRLVLDTCHRIVVMAVDPAAGIGGVLQIGTAQQIAGSQLPGVRRLLDSLLPFGPAPRGADDPPADEDT